MSTKLTKKEQDVIKGFINSYKEIYQSISEVETSLDLLFNKHKELNLELENKRKDEIEFLKKMERKYGKLAYDTVKSEIVVITNEYTENNS